MATKLSILILEDQPFYTDVLRLRLLEDNIEVDLKIVGNKREFLDQLQHQTFDAIISDYVLPDINGKEAIALAKEISPATPLIIFTGSVDEETAVDCMKQGAADYVLKQQPTRLVPALLSVIEAKKKQLELAQQKEILQTIFDNMPLMIGFVGSDSKIRLVNRAWENVLGWTFEELQKRGGYIFDKIYPDPAYRKHVEQFVADAKGKWADFKSMTKDGRIVDTHWTNVRLSDGTLIGIGIDITERKRAETSINSLLEISEKLHSTLEVDQLLESLIIEAMKLTDSALGWIGLPSEKGMVLHKHISEQFQSVPFEYTWPPGIGWPGWVLVHKVPYVSNDARSDNVIVPEIRERFGVKSGIDAPILDPSGIILGFFEVNNKKAGAYTEEDVRKLVAVSHIAAVALQNAITYKNLVHTQKQLKNSGERLRNLSARLQSIREEEKASIAREIHDEFGQVLTALKMDLSFIDNHVKSSNIDSDGVSERIQKMSATIDSTLDKVRLLVSDLRPDILDNLGLVDAVEWYSEEFEAKSGIHCSVKTFDINGRLSKERRTALFRILQGALTNVFRHSGATQVEIALQEESGWVSLIVKDNGKGIEEAQIESNSSLGILGMRERSVILGGKLELYGRPGVGTTVIVRIPKG